MRMEGPHVGIICSCGHLIHGMCELQKILLNSGGCHQQHLLYIFRVKTGKPESGGCCRNGPHLNPVIFALEATTQGKGFQFSLN